ncbi:MAG TPA: aminopeptidase [Candidatus Methylomirabilis sp.]|nr:aminopeptidase [Candidatus Methylomirabilis sp.]
MTDKLRLVPLLLWSLAVTACASPAYYYQAVSGEMQILSNRRPIEDVLNDPATPPQTRTQLELAQRLREFASRELLLPDNRSYRLYVDLHRSYAVWNVFAAPELSLEPKEWCFIVTGCVRYRGYFARAAAEQFADALKQKGYDVYVGGVLAFSTLGWFNDPLLNTFIDRPEAALAGLLFHELAHQKIYVTGDTSFNESFATTVELEGVKRWFERNGTPQQVDAYRQKLQRREEFIELMLRHRAHLSEIYASRLSDTEKRAAKAHEFNELRQDYAGLKASWGGDTTYDGWFARDLNNAQLIAVGLYTQYVSAFQKLLAQHHGDLAAFYGAVDRLAHLPRAQRDADLRDLVTSR